MAGGEEQQELRAPASRGRAAAYRRTHARILLPCDEHQPGGAMKDDGMARSPRAGAPRRNGCAAWRGGGSGAGPGGRQQVNRCPKKPDGQGEPRLIAPAGSGPPEGPAGWTLRLPADRSRCAGR